MIRNFKHTTMYALLLNDNYTTRTFNGILRKTNRPGFLTGTFLFILSLFSCAQKPPDWHMQPVALQTKWASQVTPDNVLPEYPRPQMVRPEWVNLNGLWEYAVTDINAPKPTHFDGEILVPFPIESALSGVKKWFLPYQRLWYKRSITKPSLKNGQRVLLHFGAVDWAATVYLNGQPLGSHLGGYQHFSFDITTLLKPGHNELVVSVVDPSDMGGNPYGKQSLYPHKILYTASSGIWQTVWLETVPSAYVTTLEMTPDVDSHCLGLRVYTNDTTGYTIEATALAGDVPVGRITGRPRQLLDLSMPYAHLWSPDDPYLYSLQIRLLYKGHVVDSVSSYFGMRKISIAKDSTGIERIFLNNKYCFNLGVLDQGFWPEGLYTAPTDSALQFDISTMKAMGFNTIRKHMKIEPDRWYYHCDRLGMLVWQDMIPAGHHTIYAREEFITETEAHLTQLYNYPSIIMWVLFNEGWGVFDQQTITEWAKAADSSRIINGHSGENLDENSTTPLWAGSDLVDVHDYPGPDIGPPLPGKAQVLGEWGGVRVPIPGHQWKSLSGWGYISATPSQFLQRYTYLMRHLVLCEKEGLSAAIYTQPYDVESEENGLMTYDREVIKLPLEQVREINERMYK
jgi:hypothetical protein